MKRHTTSPLSCKREAPFLFLLLLFVGMRIGYLFAGGVAIDSDEAIVGLMGRHILNGEHAVFFYGQQYMGSLEAYVAALFFFLFGAFPWSLKLAPFLFALLFFLLTVHFARTLYDRRTGLITGCLLVFASPFFLIWSVKARGGYMETLFFGTLLLVLAHRLLVYAAPMQTDGLREPRPRLRILLNGLLFITVVVLSLQFLRGGLSLQIGTLSISSRGFIRPLSILSALWLTGYIGCKGEAICWSRLNTPYWRSMALTGLVTGLSWWTNQLILFYLLPIGCVLGWRLRKTVHTGAGQFYFLLSFVPPFLLGSLPYWRYGMVEGFSGAGVTGLAPMGRWLSQGVQFFHTAVPVLLGCWFDVGTAPFVTIFSLVILVVSFLSLLFLAKRVLTGHAEERPGHQDGIEAVFFLFCLFYPFLFAISSMGWFASEPRYLLPLFSVLPIVWATFLSRLFERSRPLFVLLLIPFVLLTMLQAATLNIHALQPWVYNLELPVDFKPLIRLLRDNKIQHLYADYWVAYRVAFESEEEIIATVYPGSGEDRYPAYTKQVNRAGRPAYIVMRTMSDAFEGMLGDMGIRHYKTAECWPFVVFFSLELDGRENETSPLALLDSNLVTCGENNTQQFAVDGDMATRWQSQRGKEQLASLQLDLGRTTAVDRIDIIAGQFFGELPSSLQVEVAVEEGKWNRVGTYREVEQQLYYHKPKHPLGFWHARFSVDLEGREVRYIRLSSPQADRPWSIAELEIYPVQPMSGAN